MELFKLLGTIAVDSTAANKAIDDTTGNAEASESRITTAFKKIGAAVTTYFAVDKIKEFGTETLEAAASAEASASQFTQVFGDSEAGASWWLSAVADNAGIAETRMKDSFTKIAAFAKTTGMDTEDSLALSVRAMTAVTDSAAFYDRTLEETTESLQSFLKGNFENDAALGISCTETTRNAAANELYGKSFKDLSENQKQLTLLKMVEDANELSGAMGQAARESDTWTNQTGNLKQSFTDLKAEIGGHLLPTAVSLVTRFSDFVALATEKVDPAVEFLSEKFSDLKSWVQDIGGYAEEKFQPIISAVGDAFESVKEKVEPLIEKFKEYFTSGEATEDITTRIKDVIDKLSGIYEVAKTNIENFISTITDYIENSEEVETITNAVKDAVEFLGEKWTEAKELMQPYIDKLIELKDKIAEYVESGQLGEDVAEGIATAFEAVYDAAGWVVEKITEFSNWCTEHQTEIRDMAIFIGSMATAWGLVTGALKLWTAVTTLASGATTIFGTAMAFLNSPITLITVAIGAVIAIGALLIAHWDEIKEWAIGLWDSIKETFSGIKDSIVEAWQNVKDSVSETVENIKEAISEKFDAIKEKMGNVMQAAKDTVSEKLSNMKAAYDRHGGGIKGAVSATMEGVKGYYSAGFTFVDNLTGGKLSNIANTVKNKMESAKTAVSTAFTNIKSSFTNGLSNALTTVTSKLTAIKEKFSSILESARTTVSNVIEKIKGVFNFSWSLPHLKLPHFSISGSFSLNPPSVPSFGISWYKKAYENAMLLNDPTIFGFSAASGKFLGGGDGNGTEVVAGSGTLMDMIQNAVSAEMNAVANYLERITALLVQFFPEALSAMQDQVMVLDDGTLVAKLTPRIDAELGRLAIKKGRGR